MRLACDTGGTFTDLVVEDGNELRLFKASTTPDDPVRGVLDALALAAQHYDEPRDRFLARADMFIHGTTRAINAILTGNTAKTALLTTLGHQDILVIREGGRTEPYNFKVPYPEPYIPRQRTFAIPERINSAGQIVRPLDEAATIEVISTLREAGVEAVAVCLLWSMTNPSHEQRIGELLTEHLPGIPFTLSYRLSPTLREYRRASATAIDASLKPLMFDYLHGLRDRLQQAGFSGRTLMLTSRGGMMDAVAVAEAPIHSINSGPAMAPVAGRYFAKRDLDASIAIIADTGGTTYDVSLVRDGAIPWTRETWIGQRYRGHMTGFPSVDVKSIGAGGGSIAWVDSAGLLRVGPQSAGSKPGPVAYGRGGTEPTVTDCSIILGHIDPEFFLGGSMILDRDSAIDALKTKVADPLGISVEDAAASVLSLATEKMVAAIDELTVNQGIDPRDAVLIGGGGAAGLNAVAVGRRLGCKGVLIPESGAVLSAAGALMSEVTTHSAQMRFTPSSGFDFAGVSALLDELEGKCRSFLVRSGDEGTDLTVKASVEARYPHQIWEIDVPLPKGRVENEEDLFALKEAFHRAHETLFEVSDRDSEVEFVTWQVEAHSQARNGEAARLPTARDLGPESTSRRAYFPEYGWSDVRVERFETMDPRSAVAGPAIIESSFTTVVVDQGAQATKTEGGGLRIIFDQGY